MRFCFESIWEKTTIAKVAQVVSGGTPETDNEMYWNGNIQWFTPSEVGQTKYVTKSKRTISEIGLNKSSAKLLPTGSLLLSSRATVGECSIALQECATNQGFQSLIANNKINNEFLYYLIATKKSHFIKYACGSTFLELSNKEICKTIIFVPSIDEQKKIALFLSKIDQRIEAQKKIICLLESQINQIRNTLINEIEKQHSSILLGEIIDEYNEKTTDNNMYPVLSSTKSGIHLQSEYFNKEAASDDTTGYKIIPKGYCTYRSMSDTGEFTFNVQKLIEIGIVSPAYPVFTTKYNNDFIIEYLNNSIKLRNNILLLKEGGTRFALSLKKLMTLEIPKISIIEQNEFIDLINKFNHKIKNEKQILSLYNKQKQYLLDKLFI